MRSLFIPLAAALAAGTFPLPPDAARAVEMARAGDFPGLSDRFERAIRLSRAQIAALLDDGAADDEDLLCAHRRGLADLLVARARAIALGLLP